MYVFFKELADDEERRRGERNQGVGNDNEGLVTEHMCRHRLRTSILQAIAQVRTHTSNVAAQTPHHVANGGTLVTPPRAVCRSRTFFDRISRGNNLTKVGSGSKPRDTAMLIAAQARACVDCPTLQVVGAQSTNTALKAIAIARTFLKDCGDTDGECLSLPTPLPSMYPPP